MESPPMKRLRSDLSLSLAPATPPPKPSALGHGRLPDLRSLKPEERGVRLVQLLLACAGHAASGNVPKADACLRLIAALSSPSGDSLQRLAARLSAALAARLLRSRLPGLLSALRRPPAVAPSSSAASNPAFARALPYLPFAHAVVARTVLRALAPHRVVHLVDLGATPASLALWAPVLRALSAAPRGLRLTCVSSDPATLSALAAALPGSAVDAPFQFNPVLSPLPRLRPADLRLRPGEAVAVVSVLALHELLAPGEEHAHSFLSALRAVSPKAVVALEQESDHNAGGAGERFAGALQYYGAVFDSVEAAAAGGMLTVGERTSVEEAVGREAENVVACEGEERVERHERAERWVARMARAGFALERTWNDAGEEGRRVVETWPGRGRYSVAIYGGCPTICWHDRPLYSVSSWQCI